MKTERFVVSGRVQGVGFRQYVFSRSAECRVDGFVRNLPDGCVECVARGNQNELDKLFTILSTGPTLSRVTGVERQESALSVRPGFSIER